MPRIWQPSLVFLLRVYSVKIDDVLGGWTVRLRTDGNPKQPHVTLFYRETVPGNLPDMHATIRVRLDEPPEGIRIGGDVQRHRSAGEIVLDDVEVVGQRAILAEQDK